MSADPAYKKWLYANKHPRYARYIWLRSSSVVNLLFHDDFVNKITDRNKQDDLRAMGNLCRFHDIKFDTDLHEKFTSWIKKKEIKWNNTTYKIPKEQLSINQVLQNIKKLEPLYSDFALFMLTSGLRTIEARMVFENHKTYCHDGIIEIFWHRKTKNANATFCNPILHNKMDRILKFDYDHFKKLGCELRFLRKLNYTIVATKIDPLLANFMQGRTGDVSQKHYFLPMMNQHKKKWIRIWQSILNNTKMSI